MNIPILQPEHRWYCPNCDFTDLTREAQPHSRYHNCRGLRGLSVPMITVGTKAKVFTVERGDYIKSDVVQLDGEGRPVMAVHTLTDDGMDTTIYAPCATGSRKDQ